MFGLLWPRQNWKVDPGPFANAKQRPTSVDSALHMRRDFPMTMFMNQSDPFVNETEVTSQLTCNAMHNDPVLIEEGGSLAYDNLEFQDMFGNPINGRSCDVIYADGDSGPVELIVDKNAGRVQSIWSETRPDSPVTSVGDEPTLTHKPASPPSTMPATVPKSTSFTSQGTESSQTTTMTHAAYIAHHHYHRHL